MNSTCHGLMLTQCSPRDLGPLLFLIYINDLSDGISSNPKLFADDTSLFSVVQNINSAANDLNSDLMKISDWAFQWKMRFNPEPSSSVDF